MMMEGLFSKSILKVFPGKVRETTDHLAVEEPLEIQLKWAGNPEPQSISITMRTPGDDFDLAVGFLYTEGIIPSYDAILQIDYKQTWFAETSGNIVEVELRDDMEVDLDRLKRHFYTTSSCGVCGKASIEALRAVGFPSIPEKTGLVNSDVLRQLPARLLSRQSIFGNTGGLHAAALFDAGGELTFVREDVGRHNALDKLIGAALEIGLVPISKHLLLVSGRASFELVQKALRAGIPLLAAVGAPSSLAVQLAEENDMTLIGFLKENRFNIYCGKERIKELQASASQQSK